MKHPLRILQKSSNSHQKNLQRFIFNLQYTVKIQYTGFRIFFNCLHFLFKLVDKDVSKIIARESRVFHFNTKSSQLEIQLRDSRNSEKKEHGNPVLQALKGDMERTCCIPLLGHTVRSASIFEVRLRPSLSTRSVILMHSFKYFMPEFKKR